MEGKPKTLDVCAGHLKRCDQHHISLFDEVKKEIDGDLLKGEFGVRVVRPKRIDALHRSFVHISSIPHRKGDVIRFSCKV